MAATFQSLRNIGMLLQGVVGIVFAVSARWVVAYVCSNAAQLRPNITKVVSINPW